MENGVISGAPIPGQYHSVGEIIRMAVEMARQEAE